MPADPRDLCTVADVVELVPGYSVGDDTATDALLQDLLTAESRDAMERTGREITPITGLNPRSFDVDYTVGRLRRLQIGDLKTVNGVTILNAQGATVQTVDMAGVVLEPRVREDWQPVGTLWFRPDATTPASLFYGNVVVVDAVWGFPAIPETVAKAVARLTVVRYLNDAVALGTRFSEAADRAEFNIAASIRWSLDVLDRLYVPLFQSTGDWNPGNVRIGVAGVDW